MSTLKLLPAPRRSVFPATVFIEDNAFAQGRQQRALEHSDKAHYKVEEAICWVASHS